MKRKSIRPLSPSEVIRAGRKAVKDASGENFTRRISINENIVTRKFKHIMVKNDK